MIKAQAVLAAFGALALAGCSQSASGLGDGLSSSSAYNAAPTTSSGKRAAAYRATDKDRDCLARAMFFESNRSSRDGLVAVGSVVMNRLESRRWGDDLCGVVGAKRQFAPGVLTRPMNSQALPDVMAAADAVLKGERHPEVKQSVMFFHTAGLKFPYKNMHYTTVAGGNAFYEKRSRMPSPDALAPSVMVASNDMPPALEAAGQMHMANVAPAMTSLAAEESVSPAGEVLLASSIDTVPTPRPTAADAAPPGVTGLPIDTPSKDRFGGAAPVMTAEMKSTFDTSGTSVAAFDASPEQASAIGAMLLAQRTE
ncbi:MAG: cell wall hydrolase [Rhizobiaceae bacterium]|nr:cell wall hydrolase [Rhizobiaceae bacterium]